MSREDKHKLFLNTTLRLIHKKGFRATTMRDIAVEMNFEVANVYNYVDSKQSLLNNFLLQITDELNENVENIMSSSYSVLEKLKHIISMHCQFISRRPHEIALVVTEWRNLQGEKLVEFLAKKKWHEKQVMSLLEQGQEEGLIRDCDTFFTGRTMMSSLNWLYMEYADRSAKIIPIEMEKNMREYILRGVLKNPDPL